MNMPPVAIGAATQKFTLEERMEFDCALRHVMETYRLPRYHAADVAIRLLSLGQPAWSPFPCKHAAKHDDRLRKPIAFTCSTERGCGSLIRPGPSHDGVIHPNDFCFVCGAPLEARYDPITDVDGTVLRVDRSETAGDSRTAQKAEDRPAFGPKVESERGGHS